MCLSKLPTIYLILSFCLSFQNSYSQELDTTNFYKRSLPADSTLILIYFDGKLMKGNLVAEDESEISLHLRDGTTKSFNKSDIRLIFRPPFHKMEQGRIYNSRPPNSKNFTTYNAWGPDKGQHHFQVYFPGVLHLGFGLADGLSLEVGSLVPLTVAYTSLQYAFIRKEKFSLAGRVTTGSKDFDNISLSPSVLMSFGGDLGNFGVGYGYTKNWYSYENSKNVPNLSTFLVNFRIPVGRTSYLVSENAINTNGVWSMATLMYRAVLPRLSFEMGFVSLSELVPIPTGGITFYFAQSKGKETP